MTRYSHIVGFACVAHQYLMARCNYLQIGHAGLRAPEAGIAEIDLLGRNNFDVFGTRAGPLRYPLLRNSAGAFQRRPAVGWRAEGPWQTLRTY